MEVYMDEKIIYLNPKEIKPYQNNPRKNDKAVEQVAKSIEEFGFKNPIIVDKNMVIIAGHTRLKASEKLGLNKVPVIVAEDLTDEQANALRLVDNKTAEASEWDFERLKEELDKIPANIDMSAFDFDMNEINDEVSKLLDKKTELTEDEALDADEENEPTAKPGDVYMLGDHRLICGDSTDPKTIDKLMDGKKADLVFTDPPYGMKKENDGVANDNLNYSALLDFNKKWIPISFDHLKENGSWYCWGIDEPLMDIYAFILKPMIKENKLTFRNLITWDKGSGQGQLSEDFRSYAVADEKCLFVMGGVQGFNTNSDNYYEGWETIRSYLANEWRKISDKNDWDKYLGNNMGHHYFTTSQWLLPTEEQYRKLQKIGSEKGAFKKEYDEIKKEYYGTRAYFDNTHDNMNDVWHFERTSKEERELTGGHATPKPIALCARAIKSSSREGEVVLDLFGGSGSTMIACEQLRRKCYMCELEPKWVDVIIKRWETFTGKKAIKIN
jgi:DNA modification methylase